MNVGQAPDGAGFANEALEDQDVKPAHGDTALGHRAKVAPEGLGQSTLHVRGQAERAEVDDGASHLARRLEPSGCCTALNEIGAVREPARHWAAASAHGQGTSDNSVSSTSLSVPASTAMARR